MRQRHLPTSSQTSVVPQPAMSNRFVAAILAAALILIITVVVLLISLTLTRASTGADPSEALKEIQQIPEGLEERVRWSDDPQLDRPVEPDTRRLIGSMWVRGWARLDISQQSGISSGLETWFVADLKDITAASASQNAGASTRQIDHVLEVSFYSVDGSIMTFDAISQFERSSGTGPAVTTVEHFEVVALLSDGNWRLKGITRTAIEVS